MGGLGRDRSTAEPGGGPTGGGLDRIGKALVLVDRAGLGLEIGPSHAPIAPKRAGFRVHVVDHLTAAELREKYTGHPVDLEAIEEVDFVWKGEPLPDLVGGSARYDWVIASHVIEHLPDPIGFLQGCEQVLRPGGVVSLVVPDKRACFDAFRPLSTTGELLDAHLAGRTRPTPGQVFDHHASAVALDQAISWPLGAAGRWQLVHSLDEAVARAAQARATDDYIDVHLWRFVPESFRLIVHDLRQLGLSSLVVKVAFPTEGNEFHVTLGTGLPHLGTVDRLTSLLAISGAETLVARTEETAAAGGGVARGGGAGGGAEAEGCPRAPTGDRADGRLSGWLGSAWQRAVQLTGRVCVRSAPGRRRR